MIYIIILESYQPLFRLDLLSLRLPANILSMINSMLREFVLNSIGQNEKY